MDKKEFEQVLVNGFKTMLNDAADTISSLPEDMARFVLDGGESQHELLTIDDFFFLLGDEARKQMYKIFDCLSIVSKTDDTLTLTVNLNEVRPLLMKFLELGLSATKEIYHVTNNAVNDRSRLIKSAIGKEKAFQKHAKDPKQQAKNHIKELWLEWQAMENPKERYRSNAAFANDMMGKFHDPYDRDTPQSTRVIERWCTEWKKELKNTHPA